MRPSILTCALGAILLICIAPVSARRVPARRDCVIWTHRVTGQNKLFSLICRCNGNPEMLGRSIRYFDDYVADTNAQEQLTVQCIEKKKASMAHACTRSTSQYELEAQNVLRECMSLRPTSPTAAGLTPFSFRREDCKTEFRELDVARTEALLVCACEQRPFYLVHPGVIQFVTVGSPNGAAAEQQLLRECTKEALGNLDDTCRSMPERFALRGAQAFNVCCKRARTQFAVEKLQCQATVPDDVSTIGLTF